MIRPEKAQVVEETRKTLESSTVTILADYRGMDVAEINALRDRLREGETVCKVLKNTLVKIAFDESNISYDSSIFEGPSLFIFGLNDDVVFPAKILNEFSKKTEFLKVKGGFLHKRQISAADIKQLANLPTREELIAKVVGMLNVPIAGLVNVLAGPTRNLVYTLEAIRKQKEQNNG